MDSLRFLRTRKFWTSVLLFGVGLFISVHLIADTFAVHVVYIMGYVAGAFVRQLWLEDDDGQP